MKFGILGTGIVGRAHAARLAALGHDVRMGTQDVDRTLARTETDSMGNAPMRDWLKDHAKVELVTLAEAAAHGEIVLEALKGEVVVEALQSLHGQLKGKILVDIANPLDFSKGMPPTLFLCNDDSLGERVQKALPDVRIVKAFNTSNAYIQVDPSQLAGGDHHMFLCGNDVSAKEAVAEIAEGYGWKNIVDLGDITGSRGMEMFLPIWLRMWGALKTPNFNVKIVTG